MLLILILIVLCSSVGASNTDRKMMKKMNKIRDELSYIKTEVSSVSKNVGHMDLQVMQGLKTLGEITNDLRNELESVRQSNGQLQTELKQMRGEFQTLLDSVTSLKTSDTCAHRQPAATLNGVHKETPDTLPESTHTPVYDPTTPNTRPLSCNHVPRSGVYNIYVENLKGIADELVKAVYCDVDTEGGDWIVIMRRQDGSVDFNRTWEEYKNGFGNAYGEYWIGNDVIHALTKSKPMELRVDMEDFDGNKAYAKYEQFRIGSEKSKYVLGVVGYSGTAGDGLVVDLSDNKFHNGMQFSTLDADNDKSWLHCAEKYHGGWWFNACHRAHLTGLYVPKSEIKHIEGVVWIPWRGLLTSLKFVEMKLRYV